MRLIQNNSLQLNKSDFEQDISSKIIPNTAWRDTASYIRYTVNQRLNVLSLPQTLLFGFGFLSSSNPNEIYSLLLHYFVLTAGSRDCMFWLESAIVAR